MFVPILLTVFIVGYLGIIFEFYIKVNKTAVGLLLAALCWMVYFLGCGCDLSKLGTYMSEVSQLIFFLLGAMTLVEIIDSHKGFNIVISWVHTQDKRKLIILVSFITFFLSAVLDNLATTILMISILRKLIAHPKERLLPCCMVVIAANAGGAWTPIGDVTTTMLWIGNYLSSWVVMKEIFLPSLVSMCVPLAMYLCVFKGKYAGGGHQKEKGEPGSKLIFILGVVGLIAVPIIKWLTGLPPFMGMILVLALVWIVTDILHYKHEDRKHLRIPYILTKVDVSTVLFFLGILLAIDALGAVGLLQQLATLLTKSFIGEVELAAAIGVVATVIGNVPIVAATMGMFDYPRDSPFWLLIAYTAGTGGSMLSLGSAAGVALMGIEKVNFITYMKKATIPAALGYAAGILIYTIFS